MTKNLLTDLGEEFTVKNSLDGATADVLVYLDSFDYDGDSTVEGDNLSDGSDLGAITTEPSNANYARQSVTFSALDDAGNWAVDNDTNFTFDFSDQSSEQWIDAAGIVINFAAVDTSDGGTATDHLVANPALSDEKDIGSIDTLEIPAGDLQITLD